MNSDILKLREFYRSRLGRVTQRSIYQALAKVWPSLPSERLVGLGYCRPFLGALGAGAERAMAFMPAAQGAVAWPDNKNCATALVFEEDLPLADVSVDRILVVHGFEHAESPANFLDEMWRVLTPNGRLVMVLPNRRGMWARFDHTPFGNGTPYTKAQLSQVLGDAGFSINSWGNALFHSPSERWLRFRFGRAWQYVKEHIGERIGQKLWPAFSGVIVVEARKELYQGVSVAQRSSRRIFIPSFQPQGVGAREASHRSKTS